MIGVSDMAIAVAPDKVAGIEFVQLRRRLISDLPVELFGHDAHV